MVATDKGNPRLSTEKSITVAIEDENDNTPDVNSLNSVLLLPGTPKGTTLMTVKAVDNDASSNGIVTFRFAGEGNPTSRGPLSLDQVSHIFYFFSVWVPRTANTCLFNSRPPVHKARLFALLTIILLLTKQCRKNPV